MLRSILTAVLMLFSTAVLAREISAGPIWNNIDSQNKCPRVCTDVGGIWNGQWRTVEPGRNSVCECEGTKRHSGSRSGNGWRNIHAPEGSRIFVEVRPLTDDIAPKAVCYNACMANGLRRWDGSWRMSLHGEPSLCGCVAP